jgi:hypothetical protein
MATVRVALAEPLPGKLPSGVVLVAGHLVVLAETVPADSGGHRAVPIWVGGGAEPGVNDLARLVELRDRPPEEAGSLAVPEELTARLLGVAGASVTGVDIEVTTPDAGTSEAGTRDAGTRDAGTLSPEAAVARVELTGRPGIRHVAAGLGLGLAIAVTAGAPIRVPDAVMDRLGALVAGDDLLTPFLDRVPPIAREQSEPDHRFRFEPGNMDFADGLERWNLVGDLGGGNAAAAEGYVAGVDGGSVTVSSAVARPAGRGLLLQGIFAEDYRGLVVTFSGEIRTSDRTERARLRLLIIGHPRPGGPLRADGGVDVSGSADWTCHEITALIPSEANLILFGVELAGPGLVALRNPALGYQAPGPAATP